MNHEDHKLMGSGWVTEPGHMLHAAKQWLNCVIELDNLDKFTPVPAVLPLLGCEVHLLPDGTYQLCDTTGG